MKRSRFAELKQKLRGLWPNPKRKRRGRGKNLILANMVNWRWLGRATVLCCIWGGVALVSLLGWYATDLPDVHEIEGRTRKPAIIVLAADGTKVARFGDYFAAQVITHDMPKHMINAVVAVEDRRFFEHIGIDPWGMLRAMFVNLRAGHLVQGGSTITQQLAKNLFLTPARTMRRKIQEMMLALWLEHEYSKDQILTAYLNRVYLGAGSYGVAAASETYFGKPISQVNTYEAALLAGLLKAPSRYAPTNNPEAARDRAATVLATMVDAGYLTPTQRDKALSGADKSMPSTPKYDGRYFAAWIAEQAQTYAAAMGQDLVIATTLDPKLQRAAERNLEKIIEDSKRKKQNVGQAALLSITPDGAIRAYVGGYDYDDSEFDRVTSARRQPGSAFKPFVFLAAILEGLTVSSTVYDGPVDIGDYAPDNYQSKYYGETTAGEAMARSMNAVAVKLAQQHGIESVRRVAYKLGISSSLGQDLSLALGTSEVSLYEMTAAYAAIAAGGRAVSPYAISEIRTRDGKIIYRRPETPMPQVMDAAAVATLTEMMQGVLGSEGTGARAAIGRPAAGKTGTTQNYHDAWFIGFTADYVTGVWFGNDDNKPMRKITGGSLPARLWHDYMQAAHTGLPVRDLPALSEMPFWTAREQNGSLRSTGRPVDLVDEVGGLIGRLLGNSR